MKNPASNKVFGPFWGEFGWEVAQWAPYVNAATQETDRVRCMPGHAELYGTDVPISQTYPRPSGATPDMMDPWAEGAGAGWAPVWKPRIKLVKGVPCIDAKLLPMPLYPHCTATRRFVVLHCRGIAKCSERNMDGAKWEALVELLQKADVLPVVIGSLEDHLPRHCQDRRGCTIDDTIGYMRMALVVVGASSGPMHLAQACEAPVVVWSGNAKKDKPRYEDVWNHFDSPTTFVSPSWSPGVGKIMKAIEGFL
ncbi:MAG: hypothetical protein V3S98_06205 [Dehalococcoidia bacterium]